MRIEHAAVWTLDLERLKSFYERFFGAAAGSRYHNPKTQFASYFLSFESGGRLELMTHPDVTSGSALGAKHGGYAHLAFSVGSEAQVRALTEQLRAAGVPIAGEPRWTGDGYFESVILDPDGNPIEITI
jgi:lactoylglutathione lyase